MIDLDLLVRFAPRMAEGLFTTLGLTAGAVSAGLLLAVPLALLRLHGPAPARAAVACYSYFFRGTPLLAQLFLVYYGSSEFQGGLAALGLWAAFREPFFCALLVLSLNSAAYQCEIVRGAIAAVPRGQVEAAQAAAMPPSLLLRRVVLPQAARLALRPFGNEVILTLKASALASVITVIDLMAATDIAFQRTYDFCFYLAAAAVYVVVTEGLRRVWNRVDRRLARHMPLSPCAHSIH